MSNCERIKPKPYKVCVGNLRYPINIYSRTKAATNNDTAEPVLNVTFIATVAAMQKSLAGGEEVFNGTDVVGKITDEFVFRYNPAVIIDKTNIIEAGGDYFNIEDTNPNIEGRREFSSVRCSRRGSSALTVNKLSNG